MKKLSISLVLCIVLVCVLSPWMLFAKNFSPFSDRSGGTATVDNATIDSRIDQDHADNNASNSGTRTDQSITPAGLAYVLDNLTSAAQGIVTYISGAWSTIVLDGNASRYLDGTGAFSAPPGGGITGDGNTTHFPDGSGTWRGIQTADVASLAAWLQTQLASGTITALVLGDGNFTVDEFGNITFKSACSVRTDEPQYVKLYEKTSKGNKWVMFKAPEDGFISDDNETYGGNETTYYWPRRRPTFASGYMTLMFSSMGTGQNYSIGEWRYGLYVSSPFTGLLKTTGTQVVTTATAGTDYLSPTGNETITNKAFVMHRVAGGGNATLTTSQVSGKIIDNTGQHLANVALILPTAATGQNFLAEVGEGQSVAAYWKFRSATPNICLDGTCGKTEVLQAQPVRGSVLRCATANAALLGVTSSATLAVGTTPSQVKTAAFGYDIAGVYYAKAAVDGTTPGDDVIPEDLYGAIALDIGADGTIDVIEATANATGYATAAAAILGLPAAASDHVRMGTVTAMKSDGAFTFGTTSLADAAVTEAYTSTNVYTKGYAWMCDSTVGTWTTD